MGFATTTCRKYYTVEQDTLATSLGAIAQPVAIRTLVTCALLVLLSSLAAIAGVKNQDYQKPPIKLGVSGGPESCHKGKPLTGTLGALVAVPDPQQPGKTRRAALSNAHILSCDNDTVGSIIQPGAEDLKKDKKPETVAMSGKTVKIEYDKENTIDAAIAYENLVSCGAVFLGTPCFSEDGSILDIGPVSQTLAKPAKEMKVQKSGRSTGVTNGVIEDPDFKAVVKFGTKDVTFVHQILIKDKDFCKGGDSGSLVVEPQDKEKRPKPVGLLFGKAEKSELCVANPIDKVLEAFKASFAADFQLPGERNDSSDVTPDPAPDWRWDAVRLVRDRYDYFLSKLPEVVGEGVNLSQDGSGDVVIRLYLRRASPEALKSIPKEVEGVRIETVESGDFVAL